MASEFSITGGKGFHIEFANGWRISVQFGPGNYGDHHTFDDFNAPAKAAADHKRWSSSLAEIAIFNPANEMIRIQQYDTVLGWQSPDQVAEWIHKVTTNPEAIEVYVALTEGDE